MPGAVETFYLSYSIKMKVTFLWPLMSPCFPPHFLYIFRHCAQNEKHSLCFPMKPHATQQRQRIQLIFFLVSVWHPEAISSRKKQLQSRLLLYPQIHLFSYFLPGIVFVFLQTQPYNTDFKIQKVGGGKTLFVKTG